MALKLAWPSTNGADDAVAFVGWAGAISGKCSPDSASHLEIPAPLAQTIGLTASMERGASRLDQRPWGGGSGSKGADTPPRAPVIAQGSSTPAPLTEPSPGPPPVVRAASSADAHASPAFGGGATGTTVVVRVTVVPTPPRAVRLELEPCTVDDWEALEATACHLESEILRQVCVVYVGQGTTRACWAAGMLPRVRPATNPLDRKRAGSRGEGGVKNLNPPPQPPVVPLWAHQQSLIRLKVLRIHQTDARPPTTSFAATPGGTRSCVRLGEDTELCIVPRARSADSTPSDCGRTGQKRRRATFDLRVQPAGGVRGIGTTDRDVAFVSWACWESLREAVMPDKHPAAPATTWDDQIAPPAGASPSCAPPSTPTTSPPTTADAPRPPSSPPDASPAPARPPTPPGAPPAPPPHPTPPTTRNPLTACSILAVVGDESLEGLGADDASPPAADAHLDRLGHVTTSSAGGSGGPSPTPRATLKLLRLRPSSAALPGHLLLHPALTTPHPPPRVGTNGAEGDAVSATAGSASGGVSGPASAAASAGAGQYMRRRNWESFSLKTPKYWREIMAFL